MSPAPGSPSPDAFLPLTPLWFEILISLGDSERHGYAILHDVAERTGGRVKPHAGTLYRALARLTEGGLLSELEERPDPETDERRRYYALTPLGRQVAAAEARRVQAQLSEARRHGLLPEPGPG